MAQYSTRQFHCHSAQRASSLSPLVTSGAHVDSHARFAAVIHEFLDWMEAARMRLDRLDGLAYVGKEEAADAMRQIETLQRDCQDGDALLSKVSNCGNRKYFYARIIMN